VRDFAIGDSVNMTTSGVAYLDGSVRVECETPLTRVDILCNGQRRRTFYAEEGQCVIDTSFVLPVDESSWIAARTSGPRFYATTEGESLFAHSGPVYFCLNGARIVEQSSAQELVEWLNDFERLAIQEGMWTAPGQDTRLFREIDAAREFYRMLAGGTGLPDGLPDGPACDAGTAARLEPARPNPFLSEATVEFSMPEEGQAHMSIYSPSGRFVRTLVDGWLPAGRHSAAWDGLSESGRACASGVYLCRLTAGEESLTHKLLLLR
jgi:hypothetical protein